MKTKITALFTIVILVLSLAACGGNTDTQTTQVQPETSAAQNQPDETTGTAAEPVTNTGKTLVVYFSATGTTKGVAEKIANVTNADLYEIKAAQAYTDADLNWHDSSSRTTKEQNDKSVRPGIASEKLSLDGYTTIFIGYPIWWGEEPRIMDTFAESYSFDGITMIPFCTSGGSGIGRSGKNLEENAGSGTWLDGERLNSGVSEAELQTWIDSLQ
ncbi:MAG: flavodoxin [Clostridia bacterium]|nr:flavodoxin [Clostridia bacterium]